MLIHYRKVLTGFQNKIVALVSNVTNRFSLSKHANKAHQITKERLHSKIRIRFNITLNKESPK